MVVCGNKNQFNMKKLLTLCLVAYTALASAGGGGPVTPGTFVSDTTFNGLSAARQITIADNMLHPLGITEDASGNVWIGGYYDDNVNNFKKGFIAALNGTTGNLVSTYNSGGSMPGVYLHNQYDFAFPVSIHKVKNDKVYAAFSFTGGALVDVNSNGLGVNKIDFASGIQCKGYGQRNDSTIVGMTRSSATQPLSVNKFYAFNAMAGSNYAAHEISNYYNGNQSWFASSVYSGQQVELQPDGKMLVATTPYEVYRYKANSHQLDSTFGVNGYSYITPLPFSGGQLTHRCVDLLVQPSGKILYTLGYGNYNFIIRLNADGSQDLSFNNNQQYIMEAMADNAGTPALFTGNTYVGMAQLSDGKFVVLANYLSNQQLSFTPSEIAEAKLADAAASSYYLLKAYNEDGTPDHTFGENTSNTMLIHLNNNNTTSTQATEIYVGANDAIYITGRTRPSSGSAITESAFVTKLKKHVAANPCTGFQLIDFNSKPGTDATNGNGTINVKVSGGTAPYSYNVTLNGSPAATGNLTADSATITVAASNNGYDVTVTDANGCTVNGNAIVASCVGITANAQQYTAPANGQCNGEITISIAGNATGNAGPFTLPDFTSGGNPFQAPSSPFYLGGLCADSTYTIEIVTGYECVVFDTITLSSGNGCTPPPAPALTLSNDTLYASTTGVTGGYDWYLDGIVIATTNFPTNYIVITSNGSYTVIAGNGVGCVSPESSPLVVNTVGITETENAVSMNIYPNPAKGLLMISTTEQIESVSVFNMLGEQVKIEKGNVSKLSVSELSTGVYTLQILTTSGSKAAKLFAKD